MFGKTVTVRWWRLITICLQTGALRGLLRLHPDEQQREPPGDGGHHQPQGDGHLPLRDDGQQAAAARGQEKVRGERTGEGERGRESQDILQSGLSHLSASLQAAAQPGHGARLPPRGWTAGRGRGQPGGRVEEYQSGEK